MAIQMRRGNIADYDASMMRPGEIAVATDTEQVFVGMANGAVEIAKKSDLDSVSDTILDAKVKALESIYGGEPSTVATVAEMTNTDLTYIYSGSETGYTAGHWYYWDGTAWTDGGQYASGMILDEISEGILKSYVTEGSYTSAGVTTERISDTELKVYGTCTANRRFNVYNGFQTVRTTTSPFQEMLPAGTYRISLTANKTVGNPRVTFTYTTYADALWTVLNGQTVIYEFTQPFMFGFYANTNINYGTADDPTIVTLRIESLTAKDEVARAKVDSIAISETVSGSVVAFPDGADGYPVKSLTVAVEPIQSGSGDPSPSNIRPISGWDTVAVIRTGTNMLGGTALANAVTDAIPSATITDDYVSFASTATASHPIWNKFKPNTVYTFILTVYKNSNTGANMRVYYTDGTYTNLTVSSTAQKVVLVFTSSSSKSVDRLVKTNAGGTTQLYFNESGVFEGTLSEEQFEEYTAKEYVINIGDTVYGGTLDVVNGKMVVDRKAVDLGDLSWTMSSTRFYSNLTDAIAAKVGGDTNALCSSYRRVPYNNSTFATGDFCVCDSNFSGTKRCLFQNANIASADDFKTSVTGQTLVYTLATPIEIPLTPTQITTLLGGNTIWADAGDVSVEYVADTKLFILKVIGS